MSGCIINTREAERKLDDIVESFMRLKAWQEYWTYRGALEDVGLTVKIDNRTGTHTVEIKKEP